MSILTVCTSRLLYHLPLNIHMCNTDEMFMSIQLSKYKSDYFGVYTQGFNDTKDNEKITFNITHTPAGENCRWNSNMASITERMLLLTSDYLAWQEVGSHTHPTSPIKLNIRIYFSFPWTSHEKIWCCHWNKYHRVLISIFPRCLPYSLTCIWSSDWSSGNSAF